MGNLEPQGNGLDNGSRMCWHFATAFFASACFNVLAPIRVGLLIKGRDMKSISSMLGKMGRIYSEGH